MRLEFKYTFMLLAVLFQHATIPVFAQQKAKIKGYVVDSLGLPIANASLQFQPDQIQAQTNRKGYFETRPQYVGVYKYYISAIGYQTDTGTITLDNNKQDFQFRLSKADQRIEEVSVIGTVIRRPTLIDPRNAAMPVTIIDRRTLELLGSRRLDEVLREQTGMAIVNNTAGGSRSVGVQMQGLSSQYIMILIDGQPLLGRQSGNMDLSRIQVSNIERIEIIKGASSCLYGNDALGGAINIITRFGNTKPQMHVQASYGSYNMSDITAEAESNFNQNKGYVLLSTNYYRTDGFNNNRRYMEAGTTIPPYTNFAVQGKVRHQLNEANDFLSLSLRANTRSSDMMRKYASDYEISDQQREIDMNASLTYDKRWNTQWKSMTNYYFSHYRSDIDLRAKQGLATLASDEFQQAVHKIEHQAAFHREGFNLTLGAMAQLEQMNLDAGFDNRHQLTASAYGQGNYNLGKYTLLTAGLRFDHTVNYGSQLSPSLGATLALSEGLKWKVGIASGFKAPDFRTRYQVFYNPSANYYILGNEVLRETLDQMDKAGELSEIRSAVVKQLDQPLDAEKNMSLNSGFSYSPFKNSHIELNVFYHKLRNQINSIQVATGQRNMAVYSFQNLPSAVNKGIEANMRMQLFEGLNVSAGYQYLIAKDLSVKDSIQAGVWPYSQNIHDPKTGNSYTATVADYWGLENRSRHQFNVGLIYQYKPWNITFNARAIFRGKYPFMDMNGNRFIDRYDSFVDDHVIYYAGIEKKFNAFPLSIRLNMDNVTNYINYMIPGQMGRLSTVGLSYRIIKK